MSSAPRSAAPGARRPRRRPGENRAGLIAAGTIEFGLHGYAAAQTSAIAARAGVSQPNVYANFSSKRELFLACVAALLAAAAGVKDTLGSTTIAETVFSTVRSSKTPLAPSSAAALTDEHMLLLYQAIAAAREPALAPELSGLLGEVHATLGRNALAEVLLEAATLLTEREPGE